MSVIFSPDLTQALPLPAQDSWPESAHLFDSASVWAVSAAIAAGRPLLLRGEPGIGKSQLARAVAEQLQVPFLYHVVDERSERDELLYTYDAVARLAEAQVSSLTAKDDPQWRNKLAERNFIRPGVLWWAFNWADALKQSREFSKHCRLCEEPKKPADWSPTAKRPCGPVVLVDEIDKADPSVPNGLLESLGNQGFQTAQLGAAVSLEKGARPPLVIITTNEERELPAAFLRRCLVLQMRFPVEQAAVEKFLIKDRARVFWNAEQTSDAVCLEVVSQLLQERESAQRDGMSVPGAAEFLDIVRVLVELHPGDEQAQLAALAQISAFALKKNLEESA
jgi:MoxR-like ATPase